MASQTLWVKASSLSTNWSDGTAMSTASGFCFEMRWLAHATLGAVLRMMGSARICSRGTSGNCCVTISM